MNYKGKSRHRAFFCAVFLTAALACLLAGCVGLKTVETLSESTASIPAFEMPGTEVWEVTQPEDSEMETTSETETSEKETSEKETVPVSVVETQPETTPETAEETQPANTGYVVVLDPGHGGTWIGANDGEYMEKDLALKTAFYCRDYLLQNYDGVSVYLTRESDIEFYSNSQKNDLKERVLIADSYNADILVSLHFNSDPTDSTNGSLVCVSKQPWVSEASAALGNCILEQLSALGLKNNGLMYRDSDEYFDEYNNAMDYYAICRHSASLGFPGIIVEHCFMRNETDRPFYQTDEALSALGRADAVGIANYLGLNQKE